MSQSDGFATHIIDLMNRMDFVGNIPPSMKISIPRKIYLDPVDIWTAPGRWIRSESSKDTCDYIDEIIKSLFEILSENDSKSKIGKTLIKQASVLRPGIINLANTYKDNPNAASRLRTSLRVLDVRLPENVVEDDLETID